jgi:serine/threonine protein phosphatase PrpC
MEEAFEMTFPSAILSAIGGRASNQDRLGSETKSSTGCWVLCDGLGGHARGGDAAEMGVAAVLASFRRNPEVSERALEAHITAANQAILEAQAANGSPASLRATIVVLLLGEMRAAWAHAGDSRLYHLLAGKIVHQTLDHSVPQMLASAGEITPGEIRFHEDRNRLLRALGNGRVVRPTVHVEPEPPGSRDAFLLCSDGFWEAVTEEHIEQAFSTASDAEEILALLESNFSKPSDNYSACVVLASTVAGEVI